MKEGIKLITKLGPSRPLPDPISVAHISGPVHHGGSCQFSSSGKNGTNPRNPSQNSQRGRAASIPIYSRHTRWAIEPKATNLWWRSLVNQAPEKKIEKKLITWLPEVKEADDASRSKNPSIISFKCHQRDIFVTSPNFPQGGIRYLRVGTRKRVQCLRKIFTGVCASFVAKGMLGSSWYLWARSECVVVFVVYPCLDIEKM